MLNTQGDQAMLRLSVFLGVFALMAVLEYFAPKKQRVLPRARRWVTNCGLVVINSVALRLFVPILAVVVAQWASAQGLGLIPFLTGLPFWAGNLLAVVMLDMLIYWQHVASHRFSLLWRFHKVHHADRDIDVTTGLRFHPVEIVVSMLYKFLCIILLGAPAVAVFLFEVILNASAMFNHSNVRLPQMLDRCIRHIVVTPDMHRVHHSVINSETHSNYGFFLSMWDRLFGTYQSQPTLGHDDMEIGLPDYQDQRPAGLFWSLKAPFSDK